MPQDLKSCNHNILIARTSNLAKLCSKGTNMCNGQLEHFILAYYSLVGSPCQGLIRQAPSVAGHFIPGLPSLEACLKLYTSLPPLIFSPLLKICNVRNFQLVFLSCHWYQTTGAGKKSDRACSHCEMKWLAILISCRLWPWPSLHDGKLCSEDQ